MSLTATEAAAVLGISARKVYALAQSGALPCHRYDTAVRFDPADVEAYKASCRSVLTPVTNAGALSSTVRLRVSGSGIADYFQKAGRKPKHKHSINKNAPASTPLQLAYSASNP